MDVGGSISEENKRFSVLLGSALRNNDVDKFFEIYDTTVPKDLPEEQIEHIKEEARKISELADSDFKSGFAALTKEKSKRSAAMTDQGLSKSVKDWKFIDDDDDTEHAEPPPMTREDILASMRAAPGLDLGSIRHHSRHFNNSSTANNIMGNMGKNKFAAALKLQDDHNDSGVNKTPSESTSDTDQNGSDTDCRPGMFHYFSNQYDNKKTYGSCQPSSNSAVQYSNDNNYDEAYNASDSDVVSPEDSPRDNSTCYGISGGNVTELKTLRIHKTDRTVDREDDDSNDDLTNVNLHERLYSQSQISSYGSMDNEDDEEYVGSEMDHTRSPSSPWPQKQFTTLGKNFRSYGTYPSSSSSSSCKSSLSGDVPRNGPKNNGPRPPFGDPVNVRKLGGSLGNLIQANRGEIPDMPAAALITEDRSSEESMKQSEGTKKKKKKKKASKGESGSMKDGDSFDENGNPVETHQTRSRSISNTSPGMDYRNPHCPNKLEDLQKLTLNGQLLSNSSSDDRSEQARKRKAKKKEQDKTIKAEDFPDYRGKGKLEEILEFIENTGPGKKKKKTLGTAPTNACLVSDLKNKNKAVKESKKSKVSSPTTGSFDNSSEKEDSNDAEAMIRVSVRTEPRRLSDHTTQKIPSSNHFIGDARNLDKYDLCFPDVEAAEFQVVTKTKKKKRPTNNFGSSKDENYEMPREHRGWRPVRSVTPPPTKTPTDSLATPPKAEKPAERAFSPSAFPVLSSAVDYEFPNSRGRRNSTGNAPLEAVTNDDNDVGWYKESSPTGESNVENNNPISPGGVVKISYAEMAASPKPKTGVADVINSGVSERRHSFGSMDDANQGIKEASSMACKNDPKSQSQELLRNTGIQEDDNRGTARRKLDSAFQNNELASAIQSVPPCTLVEPAAEKNSTVTLPVTSQSSNVQHEKAAPVALVQVTEKPPIQSHTGQRGPKRSKAKCVIFLDKKINDMPKNLGITFGFDENEAQSQGVSNDINFSFDLNLPASKNTCIEGISFQSESLEQIDGHKLIIPVNGLSLPAQGLHMDQNQQIILTSQSNQNQHAPVCSGVISDNGAKQISVSESKLWEDLVHHEESLGNACSKFNLEECVRYLVREWEKVADARSRGIAVQYQSD